MTNNEQFLAPPGRKSKDRLPVLETSPDLLDMTRVEDHIVNAVRRGRYRGPTEPLEYLKVNNCLVEVGADLYATLTGLICFGREPQAVFPNAVVDVGHYRGQETLSHEVINLQKGIGGTIFDQLTRLEGFLWDNTRHGMTIDEKSFQRIELHEYPLVVLRELCVNMLAHRDYANYMAASRVQMFRDRIEWVSPGGLPDGVTIENLLQAQMPRNPAILEILYQAGYVEAFGQGLDTVVRTLHAEEMSPPDFKDAGAYFIVTVAGRPMDIAQNPVLYGDLNDSQRRILALIRGKGELSPRELRELLPERGERSIQRDLKGLLEANLVEALGDARALRYRAKG